jgi:hypothetical protein
MSYQKPKLDITQQNTYEPIYKRSKQNHVAQKKIDYVKENKRDFVRIFSDELNLHVFTYLSAADLSVCARVSRQWWRLTNDRQVRPNNLNAIIFETKILNCNIRI